MTLSVSQRDGEVRLSVLVKPRSSRRAVLGVRDDGALAVALTSPPVDGAANAELLELIAKTLGVKKREVSIVTGATGRRKVVAVAGLDARELCARLGV